LLEYKKTKHSFKGGQNEIFIAALRWRWDTPKLVSFVSKQNFEFEGGDVHA
jgi:hypothetical protein